MNRGYRMFGVVSGVAASALCLAGGVWILTHCGKDDALGVGIGLYFLGKAFFVGPMLVLTALREG